MGTSAGSENIAIVIGTEARLDGVRTARQEMSALGQTADRTNQSAASGSALAATAEQSRATQVNASIGAFSRMGATIDLTDRKAVEAYRREGDALAANLVALGATNAQLDKIGVAIDRLEQKSGAAGVVLPTVPPAAAQTLERIPTQARTAANALSILSAAAATGNGSLSSIAVASGTAVSGLASLTSSARLAAAASGIGALVTVLATIISLLNRTEESAKRAGGELGNLSGNSIKGLETLLATTNRNFDAQTKFIAENFEGLGRIKAGAAAAAAALDRLAAQREAVFAALVAARKAEANRASEEAKSEAKQDAERAIALEKTLTTSVLQLANERVLGAESARRHNAELEFAERRREIADLKITEDRKTALLGSAARERGERLAAINREFRGHEIEALDAAFRQQQERYTASLGTVEQQAQNALHAAILGQESLVSAMTKALLEPLVRRLEGLAIEQGIDALADLAFGNLPGFALHSAAAAAALAGARQVAQIGGLSSGGGGPSGAGASSGGGGLTFSPRERERAGDVIVNLLTTDPYSRDNIMIASYRLQRARITNRPLYVPPTTGMRPQEN